MTLLLAVLVAAVLVGVLSGRTLAGFPSIGLRWPMLAVGGLALQFVPWPDAVAYAGLLLSFGALLVFAAANIRSPGFVLLAAGLAMNLAAIGVNGGMPVTVEALRDSGQIRTLHELQADTVKHRLADEDTRLLSFVDAIGLPPPAGTVVSVGDLLMDLGVAWFVVAAMPARRSAARVRASRGRVAS